MAAALAAPVVSAASQAPQGAKPNASEGIEYVFIPAGRFEMGCVPADTACDVEERPRHTVELTRGFWLGRTEVTVGAFRRFVSKTSYRTAPERDGFGYVWNGAKPEKKQGANWRDPGLGQTDSHPVVLVTWGDAGAYCSWAGGRLPTEAEWEYAARGGVDGRLYPWGNAITHEDANYGQDECCGGLASGRDKWELTSPVGLFAPNGYGLHDMAGNVWEWVSDWYDGAFYASSPRTDPTGPATGQHRLVRGGSWWFFPSRLRASVRVKNDPDHVSLAYGFRCARDAPP